MLGTYRKLHKYYLIVAALLTNPVKANEWLCQLVTSGGVVQARCACTRLGQQKSKASGYITVLPTPVCLCFCKSQDSFVLQYPVPECLRRYAHQARCASFFAAAIVAVGECDIPRI
ncbi:hypothetical protein GGH92_010065 [Coemansia sp. RSA 2673]|nr:hypothetical protein GGH92_010065 [Coemansia sp. RSA 2673]